MYGVIRQYKINPGQINAIVHHSRDRFLPILSKALGFVSWTLMDAGPAGLITASVFEDELGADHAAGWYKENQAALSLGRPQVTRGPILIRHVAEHVPAGYGFLWRWAFIPANAEDVTQRLRDSFLPLISGLPGFASCGAIDAGSGVVSLSAFKNRESADAANERVIAWINESLVGLISKPPDIILAEIKLRTSKADAAVTPEPP
jgi:hypothetical protein